MALVRVRPVVGRTVWWWNVCGGCMHTHTYRHSDNTQTQTHTHTGWLALFKPLSGGARVTATASRKDNHSHTALGFPRGRGGWREKRGRRRRRKKVCVCVYVRVFMWGKGVWNRPMLWFMLNKEKRRGLIFREEAEA